MTRSLEDCQSRISLVKRRFIDFIDLFIFTQE